MSIFERSQRRLNLLAPGIHNLGTLQHPRAKQHIAEGFNRRVLMLESSLQAIGEQVRRTGGDVMSVYAVSEFAIQVNAFWLNLCGALDNLAWAFQYETAILGAVTEESLKRTSVGLFTKPFAKGLSSLDPVLAGIIDAKRSWHAELRELRDPMAHRIPLYPVPGVVDQQRGEQMQRQYAEGARLIGAGQHDEGMKITRDAYGLGRYQPWMAISHSSGHELRHIGEQSKIDDQQFILLSEAVLGSLFSASLKRAAC